MAATDALLGSLAQTSGLESIGGITGLITIGLIGLAFILAIGGIIFLVKQKLYWNLKVEFKMPRSDGKVINSEWGKGAFNKSRGVVFIKRKKMKKQPLKPFDIKRYLQGSNTLTVVQAGIDDYRPVITDSWMEMESIEPIIDAKGELVLDADGNKTYDKAALMNIKIDSTQSKAWRDSFERESKNTYSITSLLHEYSSAIGFGLIILLWGIQFFVIYGKVS